MKIPSKFKDVWQTIEREKNSLKESLYCQLLWKADNTETNHLTTTMCEKQQHFTKKAKKVLQR